MYALIAQKSCGMDVFWMLHPEDSPLKQALTPTKFLDSPSSSFLQPP